MATVTAITLFDTVGWKPYPDEKDATLAKMTMYSDAKGEEIELPESEFVRLEALGAVYKKGGKAPAQPTAEVAPPDEPSSPAATPPEAPAEEGAAEPTTEAALSDLTVADLKALAAKSKVEIGSKDTKAVLVSKLAAANVQP